MIAAANRKQYASSTNRQGPGNKRHFATRYTQICHRDRLKPALSYWFQKLQVQKVLSWNYMI